LKEDRGYARQSNDRRRSERVMLQMKVTVIAEDVQRKSHQEEALTLVVNAHGGLLKIRWRCTSASLCYS